jgi:hypothetical protein
MEEFIMSHKTSSALAPVDPKTFLSANSILHLIILRKKGERPALFAKVAFPSGCQLFLEQPVLEIDYEEDDPSISLLQSFDALSDEYKKYILQLPRKSVQDTRFSTGEAARRADLLNLFETNALRTRLYIGAGTMSHSCIPNVYSSLNQQTFHATRDIPIGEELRMSKFENGRVLMNLKADRRRSLLQQRGIDCQCPASGDAERLRERWHMYAKGLVSNDDKIKAARANHWARRAKSEDFKISKRRLDSIRACAVRQVEVQEKLGFFFSNH